jgi:hypothetical protein
MEFASALECPLVKSNVSLQPWSQINILHPLATEISNLKQVFSFPRSLQIFLSFCIPPSADVGKKPVWIFLEVKVSSAPCFRSKVKHLVHCFAENLNWEYFSQMYIAYVVECSLVKTAMFPCDLGRRSRFPLEIEILN